MEQLKAVILAAGKGTRMKSDLPKVVHTIEGKCLVDYAIDAAIGAGADDICLVVGYKHEVVKSAIFLNLGRGPIVVEQDLADALKNNEIAAAGLDVLCVEPMSADNPLREIKDSNKLIITPHIAWASVEARTRLMNIILGQVKEYFK